MTKMTLLFGAIALAGCASAAVGSAGSFGPTTALRPSLQSVTEGRGGTFTVRLNLPEPAYVTAVEVYPNQMMTLLGVARGAATAMNMLSSGTQTILLRTGVGRVYTASDWTEADARRCNSDPQYPKCQEKGYVVVVASSAPFHPDQTAANLSAVDIHGSSSDVLQRVSNAVAHSSGEAWGATAADISAMVAPY